MKIDIIGHLQSNKVNYVVNKHIRCIQSVDSLKILKLIDKQAKNLNHIQDVLIEVNIAEELSKTGIGVNDLQTLFDEQLENVRIKGLMFMPPFGEEDIYLPKGQELFEKYKQKYNLEIISAGLSDSYLTAIKYGSTVVRLGSAIFGERPAH